jgi:hypothetical protein
MCQAVPDCLVRNFEPLIASVILPDPDDRHVLAAAIRCGAQAIITFNTKDFPDKAMMPFGVEAKHPDEFVLDAIGLQPWAVLAAVTQQAADLRSPPVSLSELLDTLRAGGLEQSVAKLRELSGPTL